MHSSLGNKQLAFHSLGNKQVSKHTLGNKYIPMKSVKAFSQKNQEEKPKFSIEKK